jgi:hypothetical protein
MIIMENLYIITGLILLLIILGGLLFLAAQFIVHRIKTKKEKKKKNVWVWRSFLLVFTVYMLAIVYTNRGLIAQIFPGPLGIIPTIILVIFFGSMIEIVIIDVLLPDLVAMWKRITIELLGFLLLCGISFYTFNAGLNLLAQLI